MRDETHSMNSVYKNDPDDPLRAMTTSSLPPKALARLLDDTANLSSRRRLHPAMLSGVHNPWGYAGQLLDSWSVLDLCESPAILDPVEALIGPDIVLWDSALMLPQARASDLRRLADEPSFWPVAPLVGALVLLDLVHSGNSPATAVLMCDVHDVVTCTPWLTLALGIEHPWLCIRYMPATSHFNRDPSFAPNRASAAREPLINYTNRPIWLVRGDDHAGSDFVTGFNATTPSWVPT